MADKVCEKTQEQIKEKPEAEKAAKDTEVPAKDEEEKDTKEENGDSEEASKNGNEESKDATDKKEKEEPVSCPVKRKSAGGGGDAPEGTPAEDSATPEKKAKLDTEKSAGEVDANGEPEVAA